MQAGDLRCKSSHSISCPVTCYQYMSNPSSLSKLLPTLHVSRKPRRCFPTQDSNLALLLDSENEKLHSCPVDINLNSCSQCPSFYDSSMLWTTEWLELLFPVLGGTKLHGPSDMVAQFYAAPYFLVHKKVWPPPHLHQPTAPPPPPLINDRSLILRMIISYLNHFVIHHYTICILSTVLIL